MEAFYTCYSLNTLWANKQSANRLTTSLPDRFALRFLSSASRSLARLFMGYSITGSKTIQPKQAKPNIRHKIAAAQLKIMTYFFLGYLRMAVHDKPRNRFIASWSCERSFVFVKPVGNIRGNEQWC